MKPDEAAFEGPTSPPRHGTAPDTAWKLGTESDDFDPPHGGVHVCKALNTTRPWRRMRWYQLDLG
ncbi:MAG: hypothetical protein KatS3mg011_2083 [Acidimicrobiia bacterium]|nr:MAG: hypothetical protein KatS3mg011_2083 [Acidimicrobiia bacterium]